MKPKHKKFLKQFQKETIEVTAFILGLLFILIKGMAIGIHKTFDVPTLEERKEQGRQRRLREQQKHKHCRVKEIVIETY
ncbi:MAG: hypothetical protein ABFQ65_02935 [Nanoarchaeota archaeon]